MKLGEKVVIEEIIYNDRNYYENIEGFPGFWVKVKYGSLIGYAFDGFLSSLPVPEEYSNNKLDPESGPFEGQEMENTLLEYINKEFQPICEPVEYYNGSDGERLQLLKIQKLNRECVVINHSGWESGGTELLLPNIRLSEIKNLILLLAFRTRLENKLIEKIKLAVQKMNDERKSEQEILTLEMFRIKIKHYPSNNEKLKYSIYFASVG